MIPKSISNLLEPQVWAAYIVGFSAIFFGLYQFKRTFKLNKKAKVFDELSNDIQEATDLVNKISDSTNSILGQLAKAANSANYDPSGKTDQERAQEIERRIQEIDETSKKHDEYLKAIYESYKKVLLIIKKLEKSTIVNDKSRKSARYLYFSATEQHEFVASVSKVLQSFNVTPSLGSNPNISSDTFNAFGELINVIISRNQIIGNYLNDLEIILHNDLVKGIYGKAKFESIPVKHLSHDGLIDNRVKDSLL